MGVTQPISPCLDTTHDCEHSKCLFFCLPSSHLKQSDDNLSHVCCKCLLEMVKLVPRTWKAHCLRDNVACRYYRGRGAFESMGAGLQMQPGDVAFKSNFATLDAGGIVIKRRADRRFEEEGPVLCQALNGATIVSLLVKYNPAKAAEI